jgi:hypothetical protein
MIATTNKGKLKLPKGLWRGTMFGYEVHVPCKDNVIYKFKTKEGIRCKGGCPCYIIVDQYGEAFIVTEK